MLSEPVGVDAADVKHDLEKVSIPPSRDPSAY